MTACHDRHSRQGIDSLILVESHRIRRDATDHSIVRVYRRKSLTEPRVPAEWAVIRIFHVTSGISCEFHFPIVAHFCPDVHHALR